MEQQGLALLQLINSPQHNRILRLSYPKKDGPRAQFLVNSLEAVESMSRDFEFTVELLSTDENVALKDMHGKLLAVELVRLDGTLRYFTGYVFGFRRIRSDGGVTFYEARLGPWLKFLSFRQNSYLFHFKNLNDQAHAIFQNYPGYVNWTMRMIGEDPIMEDACQFQESDFNYLSRRWEEAGYVYWYEHSASGHQLVLSDSTLSTQPVDGGGDIRFQSAGGSVEEDAIDTWTAVRQMAPTKLSVRGYGFPSTWANDLTLDTFNKQGVVPQIDTYHYLGTWQCKVSQEENGIARRRIEAMEAAARYVEGAGNNRRLQPGRAFFLVKHFSVERPGLAPKSEKNEFLILSVHHTASNNYLQADRLPPTYRNTFTCTRKSIVWRPVCGHNSIMTKILAPQTAVVVCSTGSPDVLTDQFGRIRVQFNWDREGKKDQDSSTWIRLANGWAGDELGAVALPRAGMEVVVQWLDGNPDRPIVTGCVANGPNPPPWSLPGQYALSGLRSRELVPGQGNKSNGRSNHLVLDDTHQQIQAQLRSDHCESQLGLGYITHIDGHAGRREGRGEGWEIATSAHGVARATSGLLLTTDPAAMQMKAMDAALARLAAAEQWQADLAGMAERATAQDAQQQAATADLVAQQNDGIRGSKGAFPELATPHVVVASAAGVAVTAAQTLHLASAAQTAMTSSKNMSLATGGGLFASVADTFRLFVHKAGMKLIAASGKVTVQAQRDEMELLANKVLALISETDWVDIKGKKGVRLHGNNCMIEIGEKVQVFSSSPTLFYGNLETLAPKAVSQHFNERPTSRFDQEVRLVDADNKPLKNIAHEILREDGHVAEGATADSGTTGVQKGNGMDSYTVRYKGELP
jgi:type VI secretion system secreted protein VgrG